MLHLVKVRPGKLTPVNQRSFIILKSKRPFITKHTYLTSASIVCIPPNLKPQSGVEFSVVLYRPILSLTNTRLIYFLFVVRPCINEKDVIFSVEVREKNQERKPDTLTRAFTLTKADLRIQRRPAITQGYYVCVQIPSGTRVSSLFPLSRKLISIVFKNPNMIWFKCERKS